MAALTVRWRWRVRSNRYRAITLAMEQFAQCGSWADRDATAVRHHAVLPTLFTAPRLRESSRRHAVAWTYGSLTYDAWCTESSVFPGVAAGLGGNRCLGEATCREVFTPIQGERQTET